MKTSPSFLRNKTCAKKQEDFKNTQENLKQEQEVLKPYNSQREFEDDLKKIYKEDYGISLNNNQTRTIRREHDILLANFL